MRKSRFIMQHSKNSLISSVGTAVAIGALLIGFGAGEQANAADAVDAVCDKRFAIHDGGETLDLAYCANFDLKTGNSSFKRAVIVVHGSSRTAPDNYRYIKDAGITTGQLSTTAIVAPHFVIEEDVSARSLSSNVLFWSQAGWKRGDNSESTSNHSRPFKVSSFRALDRIVERLADKQAYPNITEIVIVGHSAGSGFLYRYAAGGMAPATVRQDISFRFVPANGTGLYFSPDRAKAGTTNTFEVPNVSGCSFYDNYKYGLQKLNEYMAEVGADVIKQRYQSRRVRAMVGQNDNDPNHSSLGRGCADMLTGRHRLERATIHFNHVQNVFGPQVLDRHSLHVVPGVAHSSRQMFQSPCGLGLIYNYGTTCIDSGGTNPPPPPPPTGTEQVVFSDGFENGLGNWTQDAQYDWFASAHRDDGGSQSAEVDGPADDAALISPNIDLTGFGGARIEFSWYIETALDAGEYIAFDTSTDNGNTWTEQARVKGGVDTPNFWHPVSVTVPEADSIKLRFRGKQSTSTEDSNVDNVLVTALPGTDPNVAPTAGFDYSPASPEAGRTVNFTDTSSDDDGTITSRTWDFGDGTGSTQQAPTHSYAESDSYTVKLTVTDDDGANDDVTRIVNVTAETNLYVFSESFENGLGDWTQDSQNDWFGSSQRAADGNRSAEVDGRATDATLVSPEIALNGHGDATVGFSWYIESGLDSGEYLGFDVSTDGGQTWMEKARLKGNVDRERTWHDVRIDLPGVDRLMLQFRGKMSGSAEDANIDNVFVTFSPKQQVFADSFEDGLGDWVEDSQNDWFGSSQRAADGNRSAEVDGSATDATLVSPEIALNGYGDATVGFSWYIESGLDSGEYLGFDVSTDGGQTWTEKARLKGNVDQESTWQDVRIDLPGVDRLMLRFRGKMSGSSEDANIDSVFVTFSPKD